MGRIFYVKFQKQNKLSIITTSQDNQLLQLCVSSVFLSMTISQLCWFTNQPLDMRERRDFRKRQTTPEWQMVVLISEGTYLRGLSWAAADKKSPYLPTRILRIISEALTRFSRIHHPDSLHNTLLSQGCILKGLLCGKGGKNIHPKDRGGETSLHLTFSNKLQV